MTISSVAGAVLISDIDASGCVGCWEGETVDGGGGRREWWRETVKMEEERESEEYSRRGVVGT